MEKKQGKQVIRLFGLTNLSLKNQISVIILLFIVTFMGIFSYLKMPKEAFPEIVIPTIYIGVPYSGNSPIDIENLVTRPIEREVNSISGIKDLISTSSQDFAVILVEFNPDVDVQRALQEVKDAVDRARGELPTDLDREPNVFEINFSEFPIMYINISGDYDLVELTSYAEFLQDEIEKLKEISGADIRGAPTREITIMADLHKMDAVEVSFQDIENAVAAENVSLSLGEILVKNNRRALRITGEFENVSELNDIIVKQENEEIVYLSDLAHIIDGFEDPKSFSRSNRMPVLTLEVVKRSGENLLNASDKISKILENAQKNRLPEGIEINITNDLSEQTRDQVKNLENSIVFGFLLVILVIMFFMGVRNALFVGIAIPLSMFTAFMLLSFFGVTLNIIVLFSLILALGLLVDNGIVVVENIYRLMEEGYTPIRAAREGAGEVALPIISSTATTLSAFIPLLFWTDIIGEFMKYMPITLIIVLASSLFVALVINPVLTTNLMKVEKPGQKTNKKKVWMFAGILFILALFFYLTGGVLAAGFFVVLGIVRLMSGYLFTPGAHKFQKGVMPHIEKIYEKSLRGVLKAYRPLILMTITTLILIGSIVLFIVKMPEVITFPENEPSYINVFTEFPVGTDIHYTDSVTRVLEDRVFEVLAPYKDVVEAVISNVGEGSNDPMDGFDQTESLNKSRITISFVNYEFRTHVSTTDIMTEVRRAVHGIPGVRISVDKNRMGPPVGRQLNMEIAGLDLDQLHWTAQDIIQLINSSGIKGIEELRTDLETQNPQIAVNIHRDKVRRYGMSSRTVAYEVRTALFGKEVSKFKEGEDEHPIVLRLSDEYRYDIASLMNQRVTFRDQSTGKISQVPVSAVADIEYGTTFGAIKRRNMDRVVNIYSNIESAYTANTIVAQIKDLLEHHDLPAGYSLKFTGELEEQEKTMDFLTMALMISVALIFLILVSQFNSVIKPFIIIGSVFFSTTGVFLGLVIFKMDFVVVMTGLGIISLAGVVVNNAIVLIDFTDLVRKRRMKELGVTKDNMPYNEFINAVVEGGKIRLRPVILTAITTILGLLPLATGMNIDFQGLLTSLSPNIYFGGDNAAFWSPMAWTVIFGLFFATFLTLLGIPAMYVISVRLNRRIKRLF